MFISDYLKDRMKTWGKRKVFISAPTGSGKTTFVLDEYLTMLANEADVHHKKVLILCNRSLLKRQYESELIARFSTYEEMRQCVSVLTYQSFYIEIKNKRKLSGVFDEYKAVVCDEVHFFYADFFGVFADNGLPFGLQ